jgi:protoporphyrinogen/coproporphyrinogen III oxidase
MVDVIVVGGGVSGLTFAWKAAAAGRTVRVLEATDRPGGCIQSHRLPDGFWFELGAHTVYNSYGGFLGLAEAAGAVRGLVGRGGARKRFGLLRQGEYTWLTPPRVLLALDWLEAALALPGGLFRPRQGETVYSHYSRLVGRKNYDRVLSPFLEAVPSQKADGFPAEGPGSLFKKRPRRGDYPRSFGFQGGLQSVCDAAATLPGVELATGAEAVRVARAGAGLAVTLADGRTEAARVVAVAVSPDRAAALLRDDFHELADAVAKVATVEVETAAVVLPRERCWLPEVAFLVPVDDLFHSAVTRDPFPDPARRALAFHFRPGVPRAARLRRMAEVLRLPVEDLGPVVEARKTLPAPALGHGELVAEMDRCLAGGRLALTGNYFAGMAIEDCVQRSVAEWQRVAT